MASISRFVLSMVHPVLPVLVLSTAPLSLASSSSPPLILSSLTTLRHTRARIAAGDVALRHAVQLLRRDAEAAMSPQSWTEGGGPWSVMNKTMLPPSGDKHDYFSTAKYCWPCNYPCNASVVNATGNDCSAWTKGSDYHPGLCDNATGLPWVCHDGYANPINDHLDRGLWDSLFYTVPPLALSAFLTDNATQARRAAMLVRTWFLDVSSRMNPNLNFAQAIPGANNGTAGGIIDISDHHKLVDILDSVTMIGASSDHAVSATWSASDADGLMAWVAQFKQWIEVSSKSRAEASSSNNHGTWHDLLALGLGIYTQDTTTQGAVCSRFLSKRIAEQVQPQGAEVKHGGPEAGALPMEDGRTNSESYHSMDADGLLIVAQLCLHVPGAPHNLLTAAVGCDTKSKGKAHWGKDLCKANHSLSVRLADVPIWAAQFIGPDAPSKWPFEQISSNDAPYYWAQVFRRAANLYHNAGYEAVVQCLPEGSGVSPRYVLDLFEPYTGPPLPTTTKENQPTPTSGGRAA